MNEVTSESMLSFVANTLCCEVGNNNFRTMPRVVPDQRSSFENDELFRKLSRECEVRNLMCFLCLTCGSSYKFIQCTVSYKENVLGLCLLFQVKYTGFRDRPSEERQLRFQTECREGHADIVSQLNFTFFT